VHRKAPAGCALLDRSCAETLRLSGNQILSQMKPALADLMSTNKPRGETVSRKAASTTRKKVAKKKAAGVAAKKRSPGRKAPPADPAEDRSLVQRLGEFTGDLTDGAIRLALKTGGVSLQAGRALLQSQPPERQALWQEAGASLRDAREVAGLTRAELAEALSLRDKSLLEAVENGTATLSFELILRLAALLARHDPVPFVLRYLRTYNPDMWAILENWGIDQLPLQFERERRFVNIYRRHDAARQLSDDAFEDVLRFTRAAFEMALHFVAQREGSAESPDTNEHGSV